MRELPPALQRRRTRLDKGNASKRGKPSILNKPGHTKELEQYLLRDKPRAYCLDVPGITPPPDLFIERPEAWYALAASGCLPLSQSDGDFEGLARICSYILYALNRDRSFGYVKKLGLKGPTADIHEIIGGGYGGMHGEGFGIRPTSFIKLFRTGNFGPALLDDLSTPYRPIVFRDWNRMGGQLGRQMEAHLRDIDNYRTERSPGQRDDDHDGDSDGGGARLAERLAHVTAARSQDFDHAPRRRKKKPRRPQRDLDDCRHDDADAWF